MTVSSKQVSKPPKSVEVAALQGDAQMPDVPKAKHLGFRQLRAMLRKNFLVKRRRLGVTLCELFTPALLILVLVFGHSESLKRVENFPARIYANMSLTDAVNNLVAVDAIGIDQTISNDCANVGGGSSVVSTFGAGSTDDGGTGSSSMADSDDDANFVCSTKVCGSVQDIFNALSNVTNDANTFCFDLGGNEVCRVECSSANNSSDVCLTLDAGDQFEVPQQILDQEQCIKLSIGDLGEWRRLAQFEGALPSIPFDLFYLLHRVVTEALSTLGAGNTINALGTATTDFTFGNLINLGHLAFSPDTPEVRKMVDFFKTEYVSFNESFYGIFSSDTQFQDKVLDEDDGKWDETWGLIRMNELDPSTQRADMTIRMRYSVTPSTKRVYNWLNRGLNKRYLRYYVSGFLTLQNIVADYIANGPDTPEQLRTTIPLFVGAPFPTAEYEANVFYQAIGPFVGLVICMAFLYPVSQLLKSIVEEKETRTKETMKMMGLFDWVFVASWAITYQIMFLFMSLILSWEMTTSFLPNSDFSVVFAFFVVFTSSLCNFAFLVSVFFSRAKLAAIVGPILVFCLVMPRYVFFSTDASDSLVAKAVAALFLSPVAAGFAGDVMMTFEGAGRGITWGNLYDSPAGGLSFGVLLTFMVITSAAYGLLAFYLESVLPNQYGSKRPWNFLCTKRYWKKPQRSNETHQREVAFLPTVPSDSVEAVQDVVAQQGALQTRGLRKVFSEGRGQTKKTTVAVKGLDLTMYRGQITALLGHNGAGKTTTISMLTGLLMPSSGEASVHGRSITDPDGMREIRQSLGVCPQHNVLFDRLTVREHLELYAALKGMSGGPDTNEAIQQAIVDVGLADKADVYSMALSGGMKRKLSVAIAFIGDSKVVFLDEPTSGMDPYARRATWDLLRKRKAGRVIVLTTHFMDEADLLGDRIAIMAQGQLACVGSALFLKSRFGIGYTLTMTRAQSAVVSKPKPVYQIQENQDGSSQVVEQPAAAGQNHDNQEQAVVEASVAALVQRWIPDAQKLSSSGGEMSYQLPLAATPTFAAFFKELEARREALGVGGYGISMTTLEEVFMRITSEENIARMNREAAAEEAPDSTDKGSSPKTLVVPSPASHDDSSVRRTSQVELATKLSRSNTASSAVDPTKLKGVGLKSRNGYISGNDVFQRDIESQALGSLDLKHKSLAVQFKCVFKKRWDCARRDLKGRFFENVLPVILVALVLLIFFLDSQINPAGPSLALNERMFFAPKIKTNEILYVQDTVPADVVRALNTIADPVTLTSSRNSSADAAELSVQLLDENYAHGDDGRFTALIGNVPFVIGPFDINSSNIIDNLRDINLTGTRVSLTDLAEALSDSDATIGDLDLTGLNASAVANFINGSLSNNDDGTVSVDIQNVDQLRATIDALDTSQFGANVTTQEVLDVLNTSAVTINDAAGDGQDAVTLTAPNVTALEIALEQLQNVTAENGNTLTAADLGQVLLDNDIDLTFELTGTVGDLLANETIEDFKSAVENATRFQTSVNATMLVLHNSSSPHAFPAAAADLTASYLHMVNPSSKFVVRNHPLPLSNRASLVIQTFLAVFVALFLLIPFCYLPAQFVTFLVRERKTKAKHLQLVSGLNANVYWLGNYGWDLVNYTFILTCIMCVFAMYGSDTFTGTAEAFFACFLLLFFYGAAVVPLSYCYSFGFENHSSAQVAIAGVHFVMGFVLVIGSNIMDSLESTQAANATLKPYYRLSPPYCLGESFINLATLPFFDLIRSEGEAKRSPFEMEVVGRNLIYLVCEAIGFLLLTLVIEHGLVGLAWRALKRAIRCKSSSNSDVKPDFLVEQDEDVVAEQQRVENDNGGSSGDLVRLIKLRKVYPPRGNLKTPTVAVNDLTLGIPSGQCFGFLGINGAGKTTTMSVLTGDIQKTGGDAWIRGYDVSTDINEVRREMGYCPQFDPLLDLMTAREHLIMFARLRGMSPEAAVAQTNHLLETLGLNMYADKVSGGYSGGNKRKLSLAIALIGDPSVVFLDEPSTGMDPVSRRFMWDVIQDVARNKSVVLTTHSMEECEALCQRIGIMVAGQLQCLGSLQHLKNRFGQGYHLEINAAEHRRGEIEQFVAEVFQGAILEEFHAGRLKYRIPRQALSLSSIFETLEAEKARLEISDYCISQSTLEQIFVSIAKTQDQSQLQKQESLHDYQPPMQQTVVVDKKFGPQAQTVQVI